MTDASDFMRYFVNVPTKREAGMFVKASVWNGLADEELEIAEQADVCLGMDGSRTFDTTVVAWAEPREDGTIAVDACVFSVRAHVAHHVLHEGGKIDFEDVEEFTIDRFELYDVREVAYDPRYLERSVELVDQRLPESLIFPVEPSSRLMRDALQTFYRVVSAASATRSAASARSTSASRSTPCRRWRSPSGVRRRQRPPTYRWRRSSDGPGETRGGQRDRLRATFGRMREVISTSDAPSSPLYSQAVKAGDHVYVSGVVGVDVTTGNLAGSTIQKQTRQALTNCQAVLHAAGSKLEDVVEVGILLTNPADFADMNDEYATWFPAAPPTRYVAKLGVELPGVLVSIRMTAFVG